MADDFLDQKIKELKTRLDELRPMRDEYLRIEEALETLTGKATPKRRGRPPGATSARRNGRRRRRRTGGTRAEHALNAVKGSPGITIPEIAEKLSIKPNYVYRVMAELQKDGLVRKEGKGFRPA